MNEKIYIVEDDESIRRILEVALESHGYRPRSFSGAEEALLAVETDIPALIVFDIMLEHMDGVEAVKLLRTKRKYKSLPVIMLTAKDTELDKIVGLDAGADDYMTKPFSVLEFCARIRAQLRRASTGGIGGPLLGIGGISLNIAAREVVFEGELLELTYKEFELLRVLMENRDKALTRQELLGRIWGEDYCGETRTLDIHIGSLRQKLGDSAESSRYIKTLRGVGYRFIGGISDENCGS